MLEGDLVPMRRLARRQVVERVVPRGSRPPERLGPPTGGRPMLGQLHDRRLRQYVGALLQDLGCSFVQPPPPGPTHLQGQRMPDQGMGEAQRARRTAHFDEETGRDRGVEDGGNVRIADVEQADEKILAEPRSEHRGRAQHVRRLDAEGSNSAPHDIAQARRYLACVDEILRPHRELIGPVAAYDLSGVHEVTDQMSRVERVAGRLVAEMLNQIERRRSQCAGRDRHGEVGQLAVIEPEQGDSTALGAGDGGQGGAEFIGCALTRVPKAHRDQHWRVDEVAHAMTQ